MEPSALNTLVNDPRVQQATQSFRSANKGQGFTSLLTRAGSDETSAGKTQQDQVRESAEQLVASAFIKPMLKQARESPFKTEMFSGGKAAEKFGAQLDTILADRITASTNWPITDAIVQRMGQQQGLAAHQSAPSTNPQPAATSPEIDRHG